jgi:hypothetical protein
MIFNKLQRQFDEDNKWRCPYLLKRAAFSTNAAIKLDGHMKNKILDAYFTSYTKTYKMGCSFKY